MLSIQLIKVPKYCLEAVRSGQQIRNEHVNLYKLKIMLEILAECFILVNFCIDENATTFGIIVANQNFSLVEVNQVIVLT